MVLRAAAEAGVSRVVYASSMVVYGEGRYSCSSHGLVPPPPRTAADLAQGLTRALDGPDPVSPGYRLGDVRHITGDCAAAEHLLGWRAHVDLDAGTQTLLAAPRQRA